MRISIFFLLFLFLSSCSIITKQEELSRWKKHAENTLIIRDNYGVPHIYGKTDADAIFGMLYAQCEDDFSRVEYNYIMAIGRLAEVEGEGALYHDIRAHLFMTGEEAIEHYDNCPEWLKKLCNAFADGVNYFLYTHPEVKPLLLTRFEPWMCMYFTEGSIGGNIESVSINKIKAFYESGSPELSGSSPEIPEITYNHSPENSYFPVEPSGSNGIAISGKLTESGNTLLLINPHTTFYFRGEMHVSSEEGLNAYGAVTWGQFFIYQGFNERLGWMHTTGYSDVIDEFIETTEESDGILKYRYGEELRPVEAKELILKYKSGSDMSERSFVIYRTHHGPITHKSGNKWVATALMWRPADALTQSYLRTKAKNHDEFRKIMDLRTNSSNNTTYADADGNIAYYHGNFIPRRDVKFDYSKPVDGSDPATDWKGLHDVNEIINVFNPPNGWLQNCNSSPFTCCVQYSPQQQNYPPYMATDVENFRGVQAARLLKNKKNFTLDGLIKLAYDPYLTGFEKLIPGLIEAYDKTVVKDPFLSGPVEVLKKWDLKTSKESIAMTLAHFYGSEFLKKYKSIPGMTQMEMINYFGTGTAFEERLEVFREATKKIIHDFGKWDIPWGEINRFQRLNANIKPEYDDSAPSLPVGLASGTWGALAAYGLPSGSGTRYLYGSRGNSFVSVVEFGERLKAKSILVGGQSGDPGSPHFTDQAEGYINGEFKDVLFYREDIEKYAERIYKPGE